MFNKKSVWRLLVVVWTFMMLLNSSVWATKDESLDYEEKEVLMVYNHENKFGSAQDYPLTIELLLGHFNTVITKMPESDYEDIDLEKYDYVFVIALNESMHNKSFLEDLNDYKGTIVWQGDGIEEFVNLSNRYSFTHASPTTGFVDISYGDKSFVISSMNAFYCVHDPLSAETYVSVNDGYNEKAVIIRDQNLWYVGSETLPDVMYFMYSDLLHEILEEPHTNKQQVYLRLEDLHPFRAPDELTAVGDYLHEKDIPFAFGLIPAYRDAETGELSDMGEFPEFCESIRYLQTLGGSAIMHGYTHQGFETEKTGEGFEFWDGIHDRPIDLDMEPYMYDKVGSGLNAALQVGVYPIAFEAPHYAMSSDGYKELKKYYSTYSGQIQVSDQNSVTIDLPFIIRDTPLFHFLLPENLGYVDLDNRDPVGVIMDKYQQVSVVRDATMGVFFHPYLEIDYLKELIEALESEGVQFYDFKNDDHWVVFEETYVTVANGEISSNYVPYVVEDGFRMGFNSAIEIIIIVFAVLCAALVLVLYISTRETRKRLFR